MRTLRRSRGREHVAVLGVPEVVRLVFSLPPPKAHLYQTLFILYRVGRASLTTDQSDKGYFVVIDTLEGVVAVWDVMDHEYQSSDDAEEFPAQLRLWY